MSSPHNHDPWKAVAAFALLALLLGCRTIAPPALLTETKQGEPLIQRTVEKTGSRKEVPVNKKPRNVVAQAKFDHHGGAALISITKSWWPWSDVQVSTNCMKCHKTEPIPFTRPKNPWWMWPLFFLIFTGIALGIYFLDKLKGILFFWRR